MWLSLQYIQAINIERIIKAFPTKKVIVHCGYAHCSSEKPYMGYFLNQLGIEFFSVDQTYFNESSKPIKYLKEYSANLQRKIPYVLVRPKDSSQASFTNHPPIISNCYVFHPPTKYASNRPTWLRYNKSITLCQIDQLFLQNNSTKNLYLVYIADEFNQLKFNAIPYDIVEQNELQRKVSCYFEKYVLYYIFRKDLSNKNDKIEFKVDF